MLANDGSRGVPNKITRTLDESMHERIGWSYYQCLVHLERWLITVI